MLRIIWLLPLLLLSPPASAEESTQGLPLWEVGIGLGGMRFPDYRGAEQSQSYLLPYPMLIYRGEQLKVDDKGLRGLLFDSERVVVDISLDGAVPVDSSQNGARKGMPNLDAAFEIGPSLKWYLHQGEQLEARLNLPWRLVYSTDFSRLDSHGSLFHPHLSLDYRARWNSGVSLGPIFASRSYHGYYYDVPEVYATTERPAYRAESGYSGMRYTFSFSRRFDRFWLGGFARYDNLHGVAFADSPLLRQQHSWMAGASLVWFFHQSEKRVYPASPWPDGDHATQEGDEEPATGEKEE